MKTLFLILSISAISVSATSSSGPLKSGFGRTPEAEQVVADAGRQPNGTNSIDFSRTFNNTPETWNWRINTTELAVPSPIDDLRKPEANYSQGLKVANIEWQLQWPGSDEEGSSFQSFLKARNATASFEAVIVNLPNNITDSYKDEEDGSCKTILGEQCVQSLADDSSSREGCEHTLSVDVVGIRSGGDFSVNADTNTTAPLSHDGTLFYHTTDTYMFDSGKPTPLDQIKSALQVFIMSFEYGPGPRGGESNATVLCRIVDKATGSPDSTNPPEPSDTPSSGTVLQRFSILALLGVAILSVLAVG